MDKINENKSSSTKPPTKQYLVSTPYTQLL